MRRKASSLLKQWKKNIPLLFIEAPSKTSRLLLHFWKVKRVWVKVRSNFNEQKVFRTVTKNINTQKTKRGNISVTFKDQQKDCTMTSLAHLYIYYLCRYMTFEHTATLAEYSFTLYMLHMFILSSWNSVMWSKEEESRFHTVNTPNSTLQRLRGSLCTHKDQKLERDSVGEWERHRENVFIFLCGMRSLQVLLAPETGV